MEHIKTKSISTKYTMLIPDAGYMLTDGNGTLYAVATVDNKDLNRWYAVPEGESND